ncbi:MAG: flagellar basal-body rod protein FlgF [Candidatus Brocadiia bacterium]
MDAGVYSAASGLEAYLRAQEVLAHNLANVDTGGYKRRLALFEPFQAELAAELGGLAGAEVDDVVVDFSPGPLVTTERPLDLAIQGQGFFVLQAQSGYVYTRKGSFVLDGEGRVVDTVGRGLVGAGGGPVRIPEETTELVVDREGRVFADGAEVGRVWVVDIPQPEVLRPAAYTAFALSDGAAAPATLEGATVVQGAVEGSNTNAIDELVAMITTLRGFEAAQRALVSIDESMEQLNEAAS